MIKVYHIRREGDRFGGSRNSTKILIALDEIGEPYEVAALSRFDDCRPADAEYRKINPNGVTPTIEDHGLVLWESGAILQYLADTRPGKGLLPDDPRERAVAQQWVAWEGATLAPALLALFRPMMAAEPDQEVIAAAGQAYTTKLTILDRELDGRDYVDGKFSIADIALGNMVPVGFMIGFDMTPFPHILSWLDRLGQRPAWARAESFVADMAALEAVPA